MLRIMAFFVFWSLSLLVTSGCAQQSPATSKSTSAEVKKIESANGKIARKEANEVDVLKLLAKSTSYIGSCGGCASNPNYCCPSWGRPVCEGDGSCYCWADTACR